VIRLAILLFTLGCFFPSYADEVTFETPQEQQAFQKILREFRCVTCANQTIADSQAPVAKAMREEVYRRYKKGESIDEIKRYLTSRYGDYVVYEPHLNNRTYVLWLGPLLLLSVGFGVWISR